MSPYLIYFKSICCREIVSDKFLDYEKTSSKLSRKKKYKKEKMAENNRR